MTPELLPTRTEDLTDAELEAVAAGKSSGEWAFKFDSVGNAVNPMRYPTYRAPFEGLRS